MHNGGTVHFRGKLPSRDKDATRPMEEDTSSRTIPEWTFIILAFLKYSGTFLPDFNFCRSKCRANAAVKILISGKANEYFPNTGTRQTKNPPDDTRTAETATVMMYTGFISNGKRRIKGEDTRKPEQDAATQEYSGEENNADTIRTDRPSHTQPVSHNDEVFCKRFLTN